MTFLVESQEWTQSQTSLNQQTQTFNCSTNKRSSSFVSVEQREGKEQQERKSKACMFCYFRRFCSLLRLCCLVFLCVLLVFVPPLLWCFFLLVYVWSVRHCCLHTFRLLLNFAVCSAVWHTVSLHFVDSSCHSVFVRCIRNVTPSFLLLFCQLFLLRIFTSSSQRSGSKCVLRRRGEEHFMMHRLESGQ